MEILGMNSFVMEVFKVQFIFNGIINASLELKPHLKNMLHQLTKLFLALQILFLGRKTDLREEFINLECVPSVSSAFHFLSIDTDIQCYREACSELSFIVLTNVHFITGKTRYTR